MARMTWPRPVPTVGDRTSAAERAADPTGWALGADVAAALDEVLAQRRDVRRYRPDAVPEQIVRRVLDAGHRAPSVGHSQPWRFVVVRAQATRDHAAALADRERLRQAEQLAPDRRARLLDLQLEGIREAPLGIVVACDRRAAAAGVLGRATFPDTDVWSCACAIQNMWLAARAAGLGMGWVTLFEPADLAALLHLPEGVETLGWLCLGWPDERNPEPGLQRHGWSERLALDDVVLEEGWPVETAPAPPPSYLAPEPSAVVAARDSGDDLLAAPGSLGVLDETVDRVLALPGPVPITGTLVLAAGDHPVVRHGVSAYPATVTSDVLAATVDGTSLGAATARAAGLQLVHRHARAAHEQGDLRTADALAAADVEALLADGVALGRSAAAVGLVCLGEVGIGNTTVAAALAAALLDRPADVVVGLGSGADTAMLHRKREVVTEAVARAREAYGAGLGEPTVLLRALGGPEFALLAGVTLGAAAEGVPVVLDGLATSVAALVAVRLQPAARSALVAGQRSRETAHGLVLTELGLEPLLDLRLRAGEGVGACLAAQALLTALAVRRTAARTR
jgi:nicotinate-nucleotide--dimethylbenzimidazole phosphoribosyltransferase